MRNRTAIENGLERRPKRAASAQDFLTGALPAVEEAIARQDAALFQERFDALTTAYNICHVKEEVPFAQARPPERRASPIRMEAE